MWPMEHNSDDKNADDTEELARKESQGWDFLATTGGSSVRTVMLGGEGRESTELD